MPAATTTPKRQLTLFDSVCVIVGIIIGAGIFETTVDVAKSSASGWQLMTAWLLGGAISVIGAICYAELATSFPREGGDYAFLTLAFGRRAGFLFAWCEYAIVRPANVGMMAFVFARYASQLWPISIAAGRPQLGFIVYAAAAVIALTGLHVLGVRAGKWTQNVLTTVKVLGLLLIVVIGLSVVPSVQPASAQPVADSTGGSFRIAMVLVLFTYGGWREISYVAAEVRDPRRNLFRSLLLGVAIVTIVYVLVNLSFLRALGLEGMANSEAIAVDTVRPRLGSYGAGAIGVLVCISCLGAINGMLLTGARVNYALGTDHRLFSWLGRWNARLDTPLSSLLVQGAITLVFVVGFGWYANGFVRLLQFSAPVFWWFIFMVSVALFLLRYRRPDAMRPYRVPLYPWVPLVFCLSSAFMILASLEYALSDGSYEALLTVAVLSVGLVLCLFDRSRESARGV
jgi:amino acid transporter